MASNRPSVLIERQLLLLDKKLSELKSQAGYIELTSFNSMILKIRRASQSHDADLLTSLEALNQVLYELSEENVAALYKVGEELKSKALSFNKQVARGIMGFAVLLFIAGSAIIGVYLNFGLAMLIPGVLSFGIGVALSRAGRTCLSGGSAQLYRLSENVTDIANEYQDRISSTQRVFSEIDKASNSLESLLHTTDATPAVPAKADLFVESTCLENDFRNDRRIQTRSATR